MRILQLCPKVPWPPDDGGRVAMRVLALSLLRAGAEVKTLCLNPAKHRVDAAGLPAEAGPLRLEAVDIDTSITPLGALRGLRPGISYNVERFRSAAFERRLVEVLAAEPPDVVLLESLYMVPCAPVVRSATRAPLVLRSANVEHEIWDGLSRGERSPVRRLYLAHLGRRLREYEIAALGAVDAIAAVTPEDAEAYRRLGSRVPVRAVPVGLETAAFPDRAGQGDPLTLTFLGSLDWRPNVEALERFLDDAWPRVRRIVPLARLLVAGSGAPGGLADRLRTEGVRFLGRVADAHEFLASGAAMVVPLLSGGGVRVKILEAMALGVPVVSTPLGASGIGAADGAEILLAEGAGPFADACATLLTDRDRAIAVGRAGRRHVRTCFDATEIGRGMLRWLDSLPDLDPVPA